MYTNRGQPQLQKLVGTLGVCAKNACPIKTISLQMSHDIGIRFLDLFQDNKALGKDALKFAKNFQMSVDHNDVTTVGTKEDFFPMGVILGAYGQGIKDFSTIKEALAATRHLCTLNMAEHGYEEKTEHLDEQFPQFSRFWFVMSKGKTMEHKQIVAKKLEQQVDLKSLVQLQEAKLFMEGMGFQEQEPGKSSVEVENVKATELKKSVELLKLSYQG